MVQLFVRAPNGSTLVLDVDLFDTGMDVKIQIFERIGIQPRLLWLSTGARIIEDSHCLADRDVGRDSTVNCHLRITGGPCEICARNIGGAHDGGWSRRSGRTYLFFAPQ